MGRINYIGYFDETIKNDEGLMENLFWRKKCTIDDLNIWRSDINKFLYEYKIEGLINDYINVVNEYEIKSGLYGLDNYDYFEINKILYQLKKLRLRCFSLEFDSIAERFNKLKEGIQLSLNNFIEKEASILNLVLTNNKDSRIKNTARNGYMFLCQFHVEKTPSFSVWQDSNHARCYGCGIEVDPIEYMMLIEDINYEEAVYLLSKIYLIDTYNNPIGEEDNRVVKYRNILLSSVYRELIEESLLRAKTKIIPNELKIFKSIAIDKCIHDIETIERVANNQHIDYSNNKQFIKK